MARPQDPASLEAGEKLSKTGDTFVEQRSADDFLADEEIDAVFGASNKDGPQYRSLGWKGAVVSSLFTPRSWVDFFRLGGRLLRPPDQIPEGLGVTDWTLPGEERRADGS